MDQQLLRDLAKKWPETTDYLQRVGQIQNDLMTLRELSAKEAHTPDWLEALAIEEQDLLTIPTGVEVLRFLFNQNIIVKTARQIPEYQEDQETEQALHEEGDSPHQDVLEDPEYLLTAESDARVWALPELQTKLIEWTIETAERFRPGAPTPTLYQATILMKTARFLEQDLNQSPEFRAECWQSALSSKFYERAGNPPQQN